MAWPESVRITICERLAAGESLRAICRDEAMPGKLTVLRWLDEDEEFRAQYAQAREKGFDEMAEQIVEISDEISVTTRRDGDTVRLELDATAVARNRLRVDARKWLLSKMAPKKYGERTIIAGDENAPIAHAISSVACYLPAKDGMVIDMQPAPMKIDAD